MNDTTQSIIYCREFVSEISSLILYSHIPTALISLIAASYLLKQDPESLLTKLFFIISICFSVWSFLDIIIWFGYNNPSIIMYSWSLIESISATLFIFSFYFIYVFMTNKDLPNFLKIILFMSILPFIVLIPTEMNLVGYDASECIAIEGFFHTSYYIYFKIIFSILIISFPIYAILNKKTNRRLEEASVITIGLFTFIFSFLITGYIASITQSFLVEMYGLFAMLIFIGTIFYSVIKFKTLNIRMISTKILTLTLISLIISQMFYVRSEINFILTAVTSIIAIIFGIKLIKSLNRDMINTNKIKVLLKKTKKTKHRT